MLNERELLIAKLTDFIQECGLVISFESFEPDAGGLPGLSLRNGTLLVDREQLKYPGDLLHEAGHLASAPRSIRATMSGRLEKNDMNLGGEIMAMAWSYAACLHLDIDPRIVFHENGYRGSGQHILNGYRSGHTMGVPLMEYYGITHGPETAVKLGTKPFPHMIKWVCDMEEIPK